MHLIDLRSDTVTRPSLQMRRVIAEAEVGDDVFGEDPSVNRLQNKVAELLGKDAALFVPSGTMGNEICVKTHTQPGDEVICEAGCHILNYESGAAAFLSSVQMRPIVGCRGVITVEQIEAAIHPPKYYLPHTKMVTVENTHNSAGGTIFPIDELARVYQFAREQGLKFHLDGARIWNASVASGIPVKEYAQHCDSISVCFSKGLGAPVGSAVVGSSEFIQEAHRIRKILGGGMRQAGLLAAAALYALENNFSKLAEDHQNMQRLAQALAELKGIKIDLESVQTNIAIFDITESHKSISEVVEALSDHGVLVVPFGATKLRAVTHLDISSQDIDRAIEVFKKLF